MAWTFEQMQQMLQEFIGARDPDDPKERKRQKIIRAATQLFIRHGYRKTSISEVAERAGVAKGTVYLYAKNKNDLMIQAIAEEKRRYFEVLRPIMDPERPPKERLKLWLQAAVVLSNEMPLISRLMRGDHEILLVLEEMDSSMQDQSMAMQHGFVTQLLDHAARPHRWTRSELEDRAKVLMGLLYASGVFADERLRGELSLERFGELLAEMVVDGVSPRSSRGPREEKGET
jgi:AcrR family transcriptional regulator